MKSRRGLSVMRTIAMRIALLVIVLNLSVSHSFSVQGISETTQSSKSIQQPNPLLAQPICVISESTTFFDAIKSLSNQAKLNFYIDDLPKEEKLKLPAKGDVSSELNEICDKSDYYWRFVKPATIVMTRRWKDPVDFPSTSLAEIKMAVKNVLYVIPENEYLEGTNGDVFAVSKLLYANLTPAQLNSLLDGNALGFNDFTVAQRKLVVATIRSLKYHGYFDGWRELDWQLNHLGESYFMGWKTNHPDAVWKYQLHWSCPGSPVSKQQGNIDENFCVRPFNDLFKNARPPTEKELSPRTIAIQKSNLLNEDKVDFLTTKFDCICQSASLKQLIAELEKITGQNFKVETSLSQHRFSVFAKNITVPGLLDLIRRPNRWTWTRINEQEIYLRFQRLESVKEQASSNTENLRETIQQALPLNISSFMGFEISEERVVDMKAPLDPANDRNPFQNKIPWQQEAIGAVVRKSYPNGNSDSEIMKKLFYRFPSELAVPTEKTGYTRLGYGKMSEHDKSALPEAVFRHAMGRMGGYIPNTWLYPGGEYLQLQKNVEDMYISVTVDKDKQPDMLFFHTRKPNKNDNVSSDIFGRGLVPSMQILSEAEKRVLLKLTE